MTTEHRPRRKLVSWLLTDPSSYEAAVRSRGQRCTASFLGLLSFTALDTYGSAAEAQHRAITSPPSLAATSTECPATQHFDPRMGMCMPIAKTPGAPAPPEKAASPKSSPAGTPSVMQSKTAPNLAQSTMSMPMSEGAKSNNGMMIRLNQFMLYSNTSGPRGQSRLTGPGMWMLMYDKDLSSRNHLSVDMMGTPEHLTVGDKGTPQLLQTENVDAMHPHDYIMAVEFRDSLTLDADKTERLTFLFAPRGEAAIGPVPFMHRDSAEGNPGAPLGHSLQDGFHDVSTVLGIAYQFAGTTIETTAFSGKDIVWPLPLYSPDSYAVRVNQKIDDHLILGASYADGPRRWGSPEMGWSVDPWVRANPIRKDGPLALCWGIIHQGFHPGGVHGRLWKSSWRRQSLRASGISRRHPPRRPPDSRNYLRSGNVRFRAPLAQAAMTAIGARRTTI